MKRKALSLLLTLALLVSLVPAVTVGAAADARSAVTAYVTVSYEGAVVANEENGRQLLAVETQLDSGADVEDAVAAAITGIGLGYDTGEDPDTEQTFTTIEYGSDIYFSTYLGCENVLGSAVFVDGAETVFATLGDVLSDGTHYIDVILYDYGADFSGRPKDYLFFADASGLYAGSETVTVGGASALTRYVSVYDSELFAWHPAAPSADAQVAYYTAQDGILTPSAAPFAQAGTVVAVATAEGCAPAAAIITVEPMTVYLTVSYQSAPLAATENGEAGSGAAGTEMLCVPVALSSGTATVRDALIALARAYYDSEYTFSYDYLRAEDDYWGLATANSLSYLSSFVRVNGVEAPWGALTGTLHDGDALMVDIGALNENWSPLMTPTYIGDAEGGYLGFKALETGSSLSFTAGCYAYSEAAYGFVPGGMLTAGCSVYVTTDTAEPGDPLTPSDGVYSYTFSAPGVYYILVLDSDGADGTDYCASAERILVSDAVTNLAPGLKAGVVATAAADTYVGKAYTLNLSTIFRDPNGDALTYYVRVGSGAFTPVAGSSYSYTPETEGTTTLTFKASDGELESADTYTVTLTAQAAPAYAEALEALAARYAALPAYTNTSDQWAIAALMAYDAEVLTETQKTAVMEQLIFDAYAAYNAAQGLSETDYAGAATCAGNLARCAIVLKALGCDARTVIASDGTAFNALETMISLMDRVSQYPYAIYTQPYMLIALQQFGSEYTEAIGALKAQLMSASLASGGWGYGDTLDADTFAPAVLALAPYYNDSTGYLNGAGSTVTIKYAIDACTAPAAIAAMQSETGAIVSSWDGSDNVNATGLVMAALVAAGKNPDDYAAGGKSLVDGLMLYFDAESLFGNAMANDQCLRGLAAYSRYSASSWFSILDFSGKSAIPAYSTLSFSGCPVYFRLIPSEAGVTVTGQSGTVTPVSPGVYDLPEGSYSYTVSAAGYTSKLGTFTVTADDAESHGRKTVSVSLSSAPGGGSGSSSITVTVHVKMHPTPAGRVYTYKGDKAAYYTVVSRTVTLESGSSVFDALDAALTEAGIPYEETTPGYIGMINGIYEGEYGPNSGWLFMVGSTVIVEGSRSRLLTGNTTITWFYTDSFPDEYGSEQWGGGNSETPSVPNTLNAGSDGAATLIPADLAEIEAQGKGFTLTSQAGTVYLTPEGVSALSREAQAQDAAVKVSVTAAKENSGLSVLADDRAIAAVSISIQIGDKAVKSGFGTLTVSLDVGKAYAGKTLTVLHLSGDGASELLTGTVDAQGILNFTVTSLSSFVVFPSAAAVPPQYVFTDVAENAWYLDSVRYVYENGIMGGTAQSTFSPDLLMSRAMLVTTLWRMEGSPSAPAPGFMDVADQSAWYYGAVAWAADKGIVGGYGNGYFAPNDTLTREQLVTIFHRYAAFKGYHTGFLADIGGYPDAKAVSPWAEKAMAWAVANGIISGMDGKLAPAGGASRSQAAAIIARFAKNAPFAEAPETPAPSESGYARTISEAFEKVAGYFVSGGVPVFGGEWEIYALIKGGYDLPQGYLEGYYENLCSTLIKNNGILSTRKYTEYSRTVFALIEAGYDPTDVAGYDLTAPLADYDATLYQGINGPIWALIALDSGNYESSLRQDYIKAILDRELPGGGWTLSGKVPDADMTAMALTALVPYAEDAAVSAAMERGIAMLSQLQNQDGGFSSGGIENCESCAQVLVALAALDIDLDDPRFVKNGNTVLDGLLAYQLPNGAFAHFPDGAANYVATQQAIYALAYAK